MRYFAIGGLGLYGILNLFAGVAGLTSRYPLPPIIAIALVVTGLILLFAGMCVLRRAAPAFSLSLAALFLAFALALFNERIRGFGHPSHHLVRGTISAAILWAVWKAGERVDRTPPEKAPDKN